MNVVQDVLDASQEEVIDALLNFECEKAGSKAGSKEWVAPMRGCSLATGTNVP